MPKQYGRAGVPCATVDHLRAEWRRAKLALRFCAACGTPFRDGEPIVAGEVYLPPWGLLLYRNCLLCDERIRRDARALDQFLKDAYRALHGAGPDDVAGTA
jgi:hypothetical protein